MTERWWAPQRATTEPDAVVLAMLEPGDFGAALLATHRAGAAAIETVSKGALPNEERLASVMATARANIADAVVDTVAKSVSSPTYAALLMRDVFDDAETAAVTVYRTAVAKGVTPPVAAQRAGLVYGVPASELGKYMTVATDPKSSPAAVTDAADRVLMTYVSKLAAQEVTGEEISKTAVPPDPSHHHRGEPTVSAGWQEQLHPRDAEGKFSRKPTTSNKPTAQAFAEPQTQTGGGQPPRAGSLEWLRQQLGMAPRPQAPSRVAEVTTPPKIKPPRSSQKITPTGPTRAIPRRQAQTQPQVREVAGLAQVAPTEAKAKLRQGQLAQIERVAEMQAIAAEINPPMPEPSKALVRQVNHIPDLLQWHTPGEHDAWELDESFSLTMSQAESVAFRNKLADQSGGLRDPGMRVFRIGYLMDMATGDPEPTTSGEAQAIRRHTAEMVQARAANYVSPDVDVIHPQDLSRDRDDTMTYLNRRRAEKATRQVLDKDGFPRTIVDDNELNWVHVLPTYTAYGQEDLDEEHRAIQRPEWAVVHFQVTDEQNPNARDIPTVDEFVIDYGARGTEEGTERHTEYQLDPNQAYEIVAPPGSLGGTRIKPQQFWDERNEVVVNRWYIRPVSEYELEQQLGDNPDPFKKADAPRRPTQHREFHEYDVVRDILGRFAEEPDSPATQASSPPPPTKPAPPIQPTLGGAAIPTSLAGHKPSRRPGHALKPTQGQRAIQRRPQPAAPAPGLATVPGLAAAGAPGEVRVREIDPRHAGVLAEINRVLVGEVIAHQERAAEEARAVGRPVPEMPVLDDRERYHVLAPGTWAELRGLLPAADEEGNIDVSGLAWKKLRDKKMLDGEGVVGEINMNVEAEIRRQEGPPQEGFVWKRKAIRRLPLRNEEDRFALSTEITKIFRQFPDIAQLHLDYAEHPGEVVLYRNREKIRDQVLIEVEDDIDYNLPMRLVPLGKNRSPEMLRRHPELNGALMTLLGDDPAPVNATMEQFRLQNATVQRYRLENDEDRGHGGYHSRDTFR